MAYPKPIQNLIELFIKLPGVGPRQASRFVFFILNPIRSKPRHNVGATDPLADRISNGVKQNGGYLAELIDVLKSLQEKVVFCSQCFCSMEANHKTGLCAFCADSRRDPAAIAVVEKESDMQNLEKTGAFHGLYQVLGGTISTLDADSPKKIHLKEFHERVHTLLEKAGECEVVLATNPTTEGDTTALYIERILAPLKTQYQKLKISRLGRGLSLGSELEHVDGMTLKNALNNRK